MTDVPSPAAPPALAAAFVGVCGAARCVELARARYAMLPDGTEAAAAVVVAEVVVVVCPGPCACACPCARGRGAARFLLCVPRMLAIGSLLPRDDCV